MVLSTISWNTLVSPSGGSWDVGSNWVGGVIPGSSNDVVIDLTSSGTVTLNGGATDSVNSLTTNANTSISIGGETLSLATTSGVGGKLTLSSGTLTGAGTLTVSGLTTWSGGTMAGTGTTIANGGMTIGGTGTSSYVEGLSARTLDNYGAATLADNPPYGGGLNVSNSAIINNEFGGSFAFAADVSITTTNGGGTFNNAGMLLKSTGIGTSTFGLPLEDTGSGSVQAQSGTLALGNGGSLGGTGALSAKSGDTLAFSSGTFTVASTVTVTGEGSVIFSGANVTDSGPYDVTGTTSVTGSASTATLSGTLMSLGTALSVPTGVLNLTGSIPGGSYTFTSISLVATTSNAGTINFSTGAAISAGTLTIAGGELTGSDTVTVSGLTTWSDGTMAGTGTTIADGGLAMGATGNANYYETLSARTLDNFGAATLTFNPSYAGSFSFNTSAIFNNEAGKSFAFAADVSIGSSGGTFNNAGMLLKSSGTGTSTVAVTLDDIGAGSVQAQSGTLALGGGGSLAGTGSLSAKSGDTLAFSSGTFTVASTVTVSGEGSVIFSGATFTDSGPYDVTGTTSVTGSASTATLSGTLMSLGPVLSVPTGVLNLTGTIAGGTLSFSSISLATTTSNAGTINFSAVGAISTDQLTLSGGAATGLSGGVLTGSDNVTVSGLTTWTGGTMSGSGTLTLSHGSQLNITTAVGSGNAVLSVRTLENDGTATFSGANSLTVQGGATIINDPTATWYLQNESIASGSGSNTFNNEGMLAATGTSTISVALANTGTLNVNSGTLSVTSTFTQTGSVSIESGATLATTGAYTQSAGITTVASGGTLMSTTSGVSLSGGTLDGSGTIVGNVTNGANVVPGVAGAAGILTITGNYTQTSGGTLTANVSGTTPGTNYGQLRVSGAAALAGNLDVDQFGGYVPNNGDGFQVLTYGSHSGQFANPNLENFPQGTTLSANYNPTALLLTANAPLPVDFNKLGIKLLDDVRNQIEPSVSGALDESMNLQIPFIGQSLVGLSSITTGVTTLVTSFVDALKQIQGVAGDDPMLGTTIQQMVYGSLGSTENGGMLAALSGHNPDDNASSYVQFTPEAGSLDHTFSIEVLLSATYLPVSIAFSLGLGNFLTFSATSDAFMLDVTTDYLLSLTFDPKTDALSLDNTVSLANEPSVAPVAPATFALPDAPLAFVLGTQPQTSAGGQPPSLGMAQLAKILTANVTDNGSGVAAALGVSLDSDNDATLTLTGSATINIGLTLTFGDSTDLRIVTGISFTDDFGSSSLADGDGSSPLGNIGAITFAGVSVDLDLEFLDPIIADIQSVTEVLQPIINVLDAQIPGLDAIGVHETLLGLLLGITGQGDLQGPIMDLFDLITAINQFSINKATNTITISVIQPFQIQVPDLSTGQANEVPGSAQPTDQAMDPTDNSTWQSSPFSQVDGGDQSIFSFPFLHDPVGDLLPLLLGQTSAEPPVLFEITTPKVTIPKLGVSIPIGSIPPFVPDIELVLSAGLTIQLAVGYDLTGLMQIAHGGGVGDLFDGFFIDDSATELTFTGSLTIQADAYLADVAGSISLNVSLAPNPTDGPGGTRTYVYQLAGKPFDQILNLSGDIEVSLTISVGIEFGPIHDNLFSFTLGPLVLITFNTQSSPPPPPYTAPTILINETNSDSSGTVDVHETTYTDPNTANQTDEAIEVDYPDGTKDIYPTGALDTTTNQPLPNNPFYSGQNGMYTQIVTNTNGSQYPPQMDPTAITQGQSIVINSDVVSYNASDQPEPVNAVLIGGEGDDDLEYYASGNAILIGNGGNNKLIGGSQGTVYAFGDTIDPDHPNYIVDMLNSVWYDQLPAWVRNTISSTNVEYGVPTDVTAVNSLDGSGNSDVLEGGAGTNVFEESGEDFTISTEGNQENYVEVSSPFSTLAFDVINFDNTDPVTSSLANFLALSPDATDDLVLSGMPSEYTSPYLQIAGTEAFLDVFGNVQYVQVAVAGGTLEIGDMTEVPTLEGIYVEEASGLETSSPITSGIANTITIDPPDSGAPSSIIVGGIQNGDLIDGGFSDTPLYDLVVLNSTTNAEVYFQGLTNEDKVDVKLQGGTALVNDPDFQGASVPSLGDLGLEQIDLDGSVPVQGEFRSANAITIYGGLADNLVMTNDGVAGAILTDNQMIDGETVAGIDIFVSSNEDTTTIYGGTPAPGDFITYTDTFNIDASGLDGILNLFGAYGPLLLQAMVNDSFTITNVWQGLTTYVTGGGATNTFDIEHDHSLNKNITIIGGPGGAATDNLILDRKQSSKYAPDSLSFAAGPENLGGYNEEGVQITGTDTSIFVDGVYSIDVGMYGGTLDVNDLSSAGFYTIGVYGLASPAGDPNSVVIEPPQNFFADDIDVDAGLSIDDVNTQTNYLIGGFVAQDSVTIKLEGYGSEQVDDLQDLGPYSLIFDLSATEPGGNSLYVPVDTPNFDATVTTDSAGDTEFQVGGGSVAFHDSMPADQFSFEDKAPSGTSDFFDVADATALVGTLDVNGNRYATTPVNDSFEVDATPATGLAINLEGGDGVNNFTFDNTGDNEGISVIGGLDGNYLTLEGSQTSSTPDSVTLGTISTHSGPELSITGTTTSIVATHVTDITDDMFGGTLDVDDLAALGDTNVSVLGFFSAPDDPNHVVIEPPLADAADNLTVSYDNGTSIDDQATKTQYSITGLVTQDDVRIMLNGGGSETVDDLASIGPFNLILDGSNRSNGANTLNVPLATAGFFATMSTDADGDPELKVIGGLLSFHGSALGDQIFVDDDVSANALGGLTDTFDIDDSALEGALNLIGNPSATAPGGDTFEVTNTPATNLSTDLNGGTGANVFDIVHGGEDIATDGVNENIVIAGGSGPNTLVLDRSQTSAAAPDSVSLASGFTISGLFLVGYVAITGTATSIQMSGVYTIDDHTYGGTLDVHDLHQTGAFLINITGKASAPNDPNHVIIEPPLIGAHDNVTVQPDSLIEDTATSTNFSIAGLFAQDDVRIMLNGGGSETVNDLQTLGPYTLIFDGSARSGGSNTLNVPVTALRFDAIVATDAAGDPEVQVGGGLVSFHGSNPADQINVTDNVASGSDDIFTVTDDSALEGTLDLVGNQFPSGVVNDSFDVYNTASANLLTELTGGTGQNVYEIIHGGVNENIAIAGGDGGFLILDRPQSTAAAPDSLSLTSASTGSSGLPNAVDISGSATSITASGVFNFEINMYGGTLDLGDLAPIAPFISFYVIAQASPPDDPNHVIIEPPLNNVPDDMTILNDDGLLVKDVATATYFYISNLTAQDDVRLKLNGGGSETVNDLDQLGPNALIFDGSNQSSAGNTLNVPLAVPGFVATMATDAVGDPELQVSGGLVSFHGSTAADQINVSDQIVVSGASRPSGTFDVVDDSALEGVLDLIGNNDLTTPANDRFNVTNTAASGLVTELTGGTGNNIFDIIHGGMNQNIAITGGTGSSTGGRSIDTLILDRLQSSAAAPDSLTLASGSLVPGSLLNEVNITGSATSITMSGVNLIHVNMYGGTLEAGDLGPVGAFGVTVTGEASPVGDPNHVIIEPPLRSAPDNLTLDTGLLIIDSATATTYEIGGLVAQDDVRVELNGGGVETVDDLPTLGPYTLIFDGSGRSEGGNVLNVPLVVPGFVATVVTDAVGDPELQVAGGLLSFHGSIPDDQINVIDQAPLDVVIEPVNTFDVVDDSALEGVLDLIGDQFASAPAGDRFNVTNTATTGLVTELMGGAGSNVFDIIHGGMNQNIAITGGTGSNTLILDRLVSSAAAPDSLAFASGSTSPGSPLNEANITGSATSITVSGVYAVDVNMYGGTLDAGDLGPVGAFTVNVTGEASPTGDPNHVVIEPPLESAPDNLTVVTGLAVDDLATETDYSITGLVTQDDVRIELNGSGSETVDDLQTLGPYTLIFDGSGRSEGGNVLNVPLVVPGFVATVVTDAVGDPELQVAGGLLSFHGSIPDDQINVIDQAPMDVVIEPVNTFDVVDDSALEGVLDLVGNQFALAPAGDRFNVTDTATTGLVTELMGGAGSNVFDIIHGGMNQNIAITGGTGSNTLILDRLASSAAAPDSVAFASGSTSPGSPLNEVDITGSATSITMTDVYNIDVNMYGGTLDGGDLGPVGAFTVNVTGKASPVGDPNHVNIEPPSAGAPDNATIDTGLSIADMATNTHYEFTQFVAQDDVRVKLNGGGSETVNNIQALGPYTLILDGSARANDAGNTLNVRLTAPGFVANVAPDPVRDPEVQSGGGLVSFHGSIPLDLINLLDAVQPGSAGTDSFNINDTNLEGTLEAVGNVSPIADFFTVTSTPTANLTTALYGGAGVNTFEIVHAGDDDNTGITVTGGTGPNTLILDRITSSAAAPDALNFAVISTAQGPAVGVTGTTTEIDVYNVYLIDVYMYGGTFEASDLGSLGAFNINVAGQASPTNDPNHVIIEPPSAGAPDNATVDTGLSIADTATDTHYEVTQFVAQDDIRLKLNGGGSETVFDPETLGPYTLIIDGAARANTQDPAGNLLTVVNPDETANTLVNGASTVIPAGAVTSMVTDAVGDPEIQSGPNPAAGPRYTLMGQVAIHGSIATDTIDLNIPEQLDNWGGGFAPPPTATNQISINASALEGTLNVNVVPANPTASGPLYFTNTYLNISAVNPLGTVVFNGLDHNNFPYPDAIDVSNSGQGIVTVGDGLLSQVQGNVTINNAQLTVNNSESTSDDILTMTATALTGWTVPTGVAPPTLFWTPILYNTLLVKTGSVENIDVEEMPTIDVLTEVGSEYATFDGNYSVTFQNAATSATPGSIYIVATNPADILSVDGDYSLFVGRRLNPDGSVTDLGTASKVDGPIVFDYTGTGGNANLVFDASTDTQRIYGQLDIYDDPYIVAPAGDLNLFGVFTTSVYGGILFNSSNISLTFDSDLCPGSINNGGDTLLIENPGTDTITYNATTVSGGTQIANQITIDNCGAPITINGNGNTQVTFQQDDNNDFDVYSGISANVTINDANIAIVEIDANTQIPQSSDIVLTGSSLTGATIGAIDFTNLTGFSFAETSSIVSGITMTVDNTRAAITSALALSGANLSILGTSGPLDVYGYQGDAAESFVTVGNGTLQSIEGALVIKSENSGVNGFSTTIDDQDDGPESNVVVAGTNGVAETITGMSPAGIGFDGGGFLNLYGSAGSTYTINESAGPFSLYAGAGSTVNLGAGYPYAINSLTVVDAAKVNVGEGDIRYFNNVTIEDDQSQPNAPIAVTVNATNDNGTWSFALEDGASGFDSFEFDRANAGYQTLNLQQNAVQLTLELPASGTTSPGLTVDDTGLLATTIDEGNVPTTVAGTTGPLLLESSDPGTITIGSAGSVQSINGAVELETPNPGQTAASLIVDDSSDTTAQSATLAAATGGLYSITGLAPAPIEFTAAGYDLALKAGTGNNNLVVDDIAAGAGMTLNTGPGNNTVNAYVSGTGGFAPLTVNGGAGIDSLGVAGSGDNPVVTNVAAVGQPGAGKVQASYPPSGPTRIINYTGISTLGGGITPVLVSTTTVVTPGTAEVSVGQSAVFTASVSSVDGPPPDGFVQFLVDGSDFGGPVALAGGMAQISVTEPVGMYTIAAQYSGDDADFANSPVSSAADLVVYAPVTVSSFTGVSSPTNLPQSTIDVTFSSPIQTGSLSAGALTLTDNNSSNPIGAGVSLSLVSGTTSTYAINGLSSLTAAQGEYTLTVNAVDIVGQNGFAGTGTSSVSWLMDTTAPTSHVVNALGTSQTSDTFSVPVTFTDPAGPANAPASGVTSLELFVSVNNGPFSLTPSQTISFSPTASGTKTFTFVGQDRNIYAFHSIAIDAAGNNETKNSTAIEASTSVPDLNPPVTHVLASSTYGSGAFTLNWSGTDPDRSSGTPAGTIALVNVYVVIDNGAPQQIGQFAGGTPNAQGVYSGTLSFNALADNQPHTYSFSSVGVDDEGKQQVATPASPDVTFSGIKFQAALAVQNLVVEQNIAERSFIQYLDVNFNQTVASSAELQALTAGLAGNDKNTFVELLWYGENVTASTVPTGVNLFNTGTTASVTLSGNDISINLGANAVTSLLPGGSGASSPTKTFGDGWYLLGIDPTGNASKGPVFWEPFFRLLGDTNGDGVVTGPYTTGGTDAYTVYHAEGQSGLLLNADVNGDGAVNTKDLTETAAAKGDAVGAGPTTSDYPSFQLLAGAGGAGNGVAITPGELQALLPEAIAAWKAAGLDAASVRRLESARIQLGNLGTTILGIEAESVITINQTAAGYNWYVQSGIPSADRVDLLTVLEHELGHVIGLSDNDQPGDIMDTTLGLGVRRAPTPADLAAVQPIGSAGVTRAAVDAALDSMLGPVEDLDVAPVPTRRPTSPKPGKFVDSGDAQPLSPRAQTGLPWVHWPALSTTTVASQRRRNGVSQYFLRFLHGNLSSRFASTSIKIALK